MARNKFIDSIIYLIVLVKSWVCCVLPRNIALWFGSALGLLLYRIIRKRREIGLMNLQIAFGEDTDETRREEICKASFINLGKTIIEFMRFPLFNSESIWREVKVDGREHLDSALEKGKGVIVFLPHFGNWEFLSLVYGVLIPNRAKAIAFPLKNTRLNEYIWRNRQLLSLELIPRKNAIRASLRALKDNNAVGFFADQNAGEQGVFIDFFGKPASTAKAPVALALRTGAPILFSLDIRQPDDRHHVYISEPIYLECTEDFDVDVRKYTSLLMKQLEEYIKQYPEQWLWLHNRWKTQPKLDQ